eukprot:scaffold1.g5750.t1
MASGTSVGAAPAAAGREELLSALCRPAAQERVLHLLHVAAPRIAVPCSALSKSAAAGGVGSKVVVAVQGNKGAEVRLDCGRWWRGAPLQPVFMHYHSLLAHANTDTLAHLHKRLLAISSWELPLQRASPVARATGPPVPPRGRPGTCGPSSSGASAGSGSRISAVSQPSIGLLPAGASRSHSNSRRRSGGPANSAAPTPAPSPTAPELPSLLLEPLNAHEAAPAGPTELPVEREQSTAEVTPQKVLPLGLEAAAQLDFGSPDGLAVLTPQDCSAAPGRSLGCLLDTAYDASTLASAASADSAADLAAAASSPQVGEEHGLEGQDSYGRLEEGPEEVQAAVGAPGEASLSPALCTSDELQEVPESLNRMFIAPWAMPVPPPAVRCFCEAGVQASTSASPCRATLAAQGDTVGHFDAFASHLAAALPHMAMGLADVHLALGGNDRRFAQLQAREERGRGYYFNTLLQLREEVQTAVEATLEAVAPGAGAGG